MLNPLPYCCVMHGTGRNRHSSGTAPRAWRADTHMACLPGVQNTNYTILWFSSDFANHSVFQPLCEPFCVSGNGQINGFARATEFPIAFVIWFSWKFWSWMVLFVSLLGQIASRFARADVLSIFEFDVDWFLDFSKRILIDRFNRGIR